MGSAPSSDDRSAPARIRDAAIAIIAEHGARAATARVVAERAGVSPALVIHHYGSMRALRETCDERVVELIREGKSAAMRAGAGLDVVAALRGQADGPPLVAYLARALHDGSERLAIVIDEMIHDAEGYLLEGVDSGAIKPQERLRDVAALLVLWSLGALALHEHVERHFGVDLLDQGSVAERGGRYMAAALAVYGEGIIASDLAVRLRAAVDGEPTGRDASERGED